jgi:DNA-binding MarR family transcriptional regulator
VQNGPVGNGQPIGYWLKRLDTLIEERQRDALAAHDLTRRHWQVLHALHDARRAQYDDLARTIAPFADTAELDLVIGDLFARGWLQHEPRLELTAEGIAGHDAAFRAVQGVRAAITEGISRDEYGATLDVLRRMAANLGDTGDVRLPTA